VSVCVCVCVCVCVGVGGWVGGGVLMYHTYKVAGIMCFILFSGHELSCVKKYAPYASCDNMVDFVTYLRNSEIVIQEKKPCIIVCFYKYVKKTVH
jgi:hypothetical protein